MDHQTAIEKIRNSYLPSRFREKLCYDLEQIFQRKPEGLQAVVLFGSCARNQMTVASDLDLLILTEKPLGQDVRGELSSDLAEQKKGVATDLVFYTVAEFESSDCRLVQEIRRDGLILWEAAHV